MHCTPGLYREWVSRGGRFSRRRGDASDGFRDLRELEIVSWRDPQAPEQGTYGCTTIAFR